VIPIFAKESKLIVVFFLTVIILGSLLVYLSINNISNYKELTEKKISEEERFLAKQFSENFQGELDQLLVSFEALTKNDSLADRAVFKSIDTLAMIKQTVVVDEDGVFLWPNFTLFNNTPKRVKSALNYLEQIKKAEHKEFVIRDYKTAESYYLTALKAAKSELDSVYALNAVSRLYMKMHRFENAYNNYALILSEFSEQTNASGFSYAYFSVNQLLKLKDSTKNEAVQTILETFLSELSNGDIPLNFGTSDVLESILEWTNQFDKNNTITNLEEKMQYVSDYLVLVNNYKAAIAETININGLKDKSDNIGGYTVLKPISGITDELLFLKAKGNTLKGFNVDLETIFAEVKQKLIPIQTKFEYEIALIKTNGQSYFLNDDLVEASAFSPFFKTHSIKISLKNESVVETHVFKRKLIYGIGFILLLGVMVLGFIVLVQDVQRKKQMTRLRADFVSNVTHELKTPLTSIHMFAESILLGRVKTEIEIHKYANIIVKESENLKRMINNILDFSRKENNKLSSHIKETNLSDIVNSTLDGMKYWLELSDFEVLKEVEKNVLAKVEPEGLKQALSNLISNAIKYSTLEKKLMVRLYKNKQLVHIEIEDFGIGIPKDKLNLIFEKFYRVNSVENESVSGTGLGLTVTREIIEAQKGELKVESVLGKGSKFTILYNA